jgi:hypothetical protein
MRMALLAAGLPDGPVTTRQSPLHYAKDANALLDFSLSAPQPIRWKNAHGQTLALWFGHIPDIKAY